MRAREKAADDADWRAGSFRYCNAHFHDTLRSWDGDMDIGTRTPKNWRVSAADLLAGGSRRADELSLNDADGWRCSKSIWCEDLFRNGLRNYKGQDVALDEHGNPRNLEKEGRKIRGDVSAGLGASIYRPTKQANTMSTEKADEVFQESLRSTSTVDKDAYQRRRRRNLNLPQFKDLDAAEVSKAKRLFAQIDVDGSGTVDAEELRKFLTGLGHKVEGGTKAVQDLIKQADEGASDCKLAMKEFARLYHGLKL